MKIFTRHITRDMRNMRLGPHPAESLIETLAAITVIVIATTSAMVLIRTSLMGNEVIGEKLVAMNLALEGIEAVKNVRDTNYLNFSSDAENCWDKLGITDVADCALDRPANLITEGSDMVLERYFDDADGNMMGWNLERLASLRTGALSLYTYSTDVNGDSTPEDVPFYAQSGLQRAYPRLFTLEEEDAFTRTLSFVYDGVDDDSFEVTATVTWEDLDGDEHSISLTRTIANVY